MERLTMTSSKGGLAFTFDLDIKCERSEIEKIVRLGERLKEYEDLEEAGLLLRLKRKEDAIFLKSNIRDESSEIVSPVGKYAIKMSENHGIPMNEVMNHPMVKAYAEAYNAGLVKNAT